MKDDTISRQQFADAFWKTEVEFRPSQIDEVMRILEQLPSAQFDKDTNVPDKNVGKIGDLIIREAVLRLAKDVVLQDGCKHRCIDATMIHELPSAQFDKDINVPDKNVGKIGDLIDRQAAIDAIKNADVVVIYHNAEPVEEAIEEAIEATKRSITTDIEDLPSAQPEEYTIEMQEADIDEAMKHLRNAKVMILPSVQPEIIYCKGCRYDRDCDIQYHAQAGDLFYCGAAERRTDG